MDPAGKRIVQVRSCLYMLKDYVRPDDGLDKDTRKEETKRLQKLLTAQQVSIREAKLPVVVLVEGWAASGKGRLINLLISEIDPRFSGVFCGEARTADAHRYPFLYPYFCALPEDGKFLFMDAGWMEAAVRERCTKEIDEEVFQRRIKSVNRFERQLRDNGYLVLKLFVNISKDEQSKRQDELRSSSDTSWFSSSTVGVPPPMYTVFTSMPSPDMSSARFEISLCSTSR